MSKRAKLVLVGKYTAVALVYAMVFLGLQRLFMPKFMSDVFDGALIGEYYDSCRNHSVVFFGDCEVYQNFSPPELFREHGITSHIRGGPSQTLWQSYWMLRDTLQFASEPPQVVVLSVLAMRRGEATSEPYNRLNIDGMRLGRAKWGAINSSITDGESRLSYLLPLLRYKSRWSEIGAEDFRHFRGAEQVGWNGYLMRAETIPAASFVPTESRRDCYEFPDVTWEYLDRIRKLCAANGIELVLIKAPTLTPHWWDEWDEQIVDYAREHGLNYFNLQRYREEIGLDMQIHTPNQGQHLNVVGAEVLTRWFGEQLRGLAANSDFPALPDHRNTPQTSEVWQRLIADYDRHREIGLREFAEYGEVRTITHTRT
jgi:hypothetical protein